MTGQSTFSQASRHGTGAPSLSQDTLSVRKSLAFSLLDRYSSLVIGIASTVVLARLLTPAELGTYSVAAVLVSVAATLRDFGAGNYLLQEKELTTERIRAVWGVQLGLGALLAATIAALSALGAAFYAEPVIQWILLLLAVNFLINPMGSLTYAYLMREMRYDALAVMRSTSALAGALVSVGLAWHGYGALSLAWGGVAGTVVNAIVSLRYRPRDYPWMPGFREARRVLSFGVRLTGTSILNTASTAAPEFFLAKMQGMASAGYFSRANGLVALFNRLVTDVAYGVALSLFSQEARRGSNYAEPFTRAMAYMCALSWSFCIPLALLAHPAVLLLYGDQWLASVSLTRWLAFAAAFAAPVPLCTAALIGEGRMRDLIKATAVTATATVVASAVGAYLGMTVLGAGLVVAALVSTGAWLHITRSRVGFSWSVLARQAWGSACVALCAGAVPLAAGLVFGWAPSDTVLPLAIGAIGAACGFVVSVLVLNHPINTELRMVATRGVNWWRAHQ